MFSFGGFWHSVTLSQKRYSSRLLVGQSILSIFRISFVIFLLEKRFCIIISLLITIFLSSIFFFSNNSILAINLLVRELMFASAKIWSTYCYLIQLRCEERRFHLWKNPLMLSSLPEICILRGYSNRSQKWGGMCVKLVKEDSCAFLFTVFGWLIVGVLGGEASCSLFILTGVSQSNVLGVLLMISW